MELKYIVMTIIKILISVPSILLIINDTRVQAAALMGGYLDNSSNSTSLSNFTAFDNSQELSNLTDFSGKPFYLEKDPLTGKVDFDSRTSLLNVDDDEFDYIEDEAVDSKLYDKSNIDRKDGNVGSHKASDVNQLTPNFHDFLNLPVKYNPDKYVYPLISSSYANTKKPPRPTEIYLTTKDVNDVYLTTKRYPAPTSTKRPLSLFEQLFGEYEDDYTPTTEIPAKSPSLFQNLPSNKNKDKYDYPEYEEANTVKPERPQGNNILSGTEMGHESAYDYEDDYVQPGNEKDTVSYTVEAKPEFLNKPVFSQNFPEPSYNKPQAKIPEAGGSAINIQPIRTSEASLSIGVPINGIKKVPGQVVDEDLENEKIEFPKQGTGAKIVFPDDKEVKHSTFTPDLQPPPPSREVLQLSSKPMYHQLPSDLTPPSEQDLPPPHLERPRPPWDPRPGHFYNGRPEYIRPPRPPPKPGSEIYKRIDSLPNILPQFRPNAKISSGPHYFDHFGSMKNGYIRQPLLERPSNRPVGFFEKLIPPPPPKNLHNLRKVPILEQDLRLKSPPEDMNIRKHEQYEFYQHQTPPPQPVLINRRKSEEPAVETLQMIQAKQVDKKDVISKSGPTSAFKTNLKGKDTTEKPLYVVYPVNSAPIKLDALDSGKKETVVVGTRAELPLPPSKINQEFNYESPKDRNDSPVLKPHPKPSNFPIKSDFPYPLERPDIATMMVSSGNNLEIKEDSKYGSNNQWGAVQDTESRILTGSKINYKNPNQISVTLKTYTEKPIAVAYTPTEPYKRLENTEKYSMPNYASPVISEIRPSGLMDKGGSEITVSAVMHTHPQIEHGISSQSINGKPTYENHKSDTDETLTKLDFQAPFQASLNIDGISQGWTVVRNNNNEKSKVDRSDQDEETTTIAVATTSEFDMNNFKPQFFGGFKPIYNYPDEVKSEGTEYGDREERLSL
ncbi:hypothetical protein ILUMI_03224 [Ignelater luminosus]|uniref:Uncharacterized protein n=1 Tax=Ignelater luminosus TaxID=2038154 RepID=A0A8K0GFQ2_IGNLU|nr:hypothetical protein ILUMI_03224 [Ignelater luminosus]